jgi:hypothetical protein
MTGSLGGLSRRKHPIVRRRLLSLALKPQALGESIDVQLLIGIGSIVPTLRDQILCKQYFKHAETWLQFTASSSNIFVR